MPINTRRDYGIVGGTALGTLIAGYLIGNVAPISRFYQPPQPTAQVSPQVSPLEQKVEKISFNQPTEEHEKFLKGEISYKDLSDSVKAWFSLRHPQVEFKQEGNNYVIDVKPVTTYKAQDLGEFKFAVKVGDKLYFGLKPNEVTNIRADKGLYDALSKVERPVSQVMMYKDKVVDGKGVRQVYASLNYEKKPAVAEVAPVAPEEKPAVPAEAPKAPVEAPKAAEAPKPEVTPKAEVAPAPENLEQYLEPIDPKHLILPRL